MIFHSDRTYIIILIEATSIKEIINVLPFRIDYIDTIKNKDGTKDKKVEAINTESAMLAPQRISEIVTYILEHFDQKTKRNNGFYTFNKLTNIEDVAKNQMIAEKKQSLRLNGFNSIFAVSSIDAAKLYYTEFKRQMAEPRPGSGITRHKCAVCGRTEVTNPELEFRYCSKCEGNFEYCQDHLFTHQHIHRS